MNREVQITRI